MTPLARLRLSFVLLVVVVGLGVAGYTLVEGWHPFDALYMTIHTLATVGYGETHPLSHAGRVFTIILIVCGGASVAFILRSMAEVAGGESLRVAVQDYKNQRRLKRMQNHQIVCGYGRMGRVIAEELLKTGTGVVVVDRDPAAIARVRERDIAAVEGDASDDAVLEAAGVARARGLIAVAPSDAVNIFIVLSARALNPSLHIVARSEYEYEEHKLRRAGANQVISPYVIGGRRMAGAVFNPDVADFLDLEPHDPATGWELEQVPVLSRAGFANRSLRESSIRERSGCIVVAIRQPDGRFVCNPGPDTVLCPGEILIVLGTPRQLAALDDLAGVEHSPRSRA